MTETAQEYIDRAMRVLKDASRFPCAITRPFLRKSSLRRKQDMRPYVPINRTMSKPKHKSKDRPPRIGNRIDTWFDGGTVIAVKPYRGKYTEYFKYDVTVTCATPGHSGSVVICL